MKILNRAQSLYSNEYFISESIKFEFNQMYLLINGKWRECDESTRAINFSDMLDSQGNKIFASLSEDGKGGDIVKNENVENTNDLIMVLDGHSVYQREEILGICYGWYPHKIKVIGIKE